MQFCMCGQLKGSDECKCHEQSHTLTTTERGYGHDWQKLSRRFRNDNPLCWRCMAQGLTTPTAHAHHIVPIKIDRDRRLDYDNLAALCEACHEVVEQETEKGKQFTWRPPEGGVVILWQNNNPNDRTAP